jgi:hypothetical protein
MAGRQPAPPGGRPPMRGRAAAGIARLSALVGVIALAVVAAEIMVSNDVAGWIVGLAVGIGVQLLTLIVVFSRRFG